MTEEQFKEAEKIHNSIRYARGLRTHVKNLYKERAERKAIYFCDLFSKQEHEIPCKDTHIEFVNFIFEQIATFAYKKQTYFEDKLHKL